MMISKKHYEDAKNIMCSSSATLQDIQDKNNLLLIGTVSQNSTARDEEAKGEAGIAENEEKEVVVEDYHNVNAENASSFLPVKAFVQ